MPFFSVIIPLYNKESFIRNTIESVLNQTFQDFEIIVVDDGSTDKSAEKVKELNNPKINHFRTENQGVSNARNIGIQKSKADYICFLDADDYWLENHLDVLHNLILDFPEAGMYCSRYTMKISSSKEIKPKFQGIDNNFRGYIDDYFYSSLVYRVAWTSAIVIKKNVFDDVGMFDVNISSGQDTDMWIRVTLKYRTAVSDRVTTIYNAQIANSLSKTNILKKKLMDFEKFSQDEKKNPSLKKFLDLYRTGYAIAFYMNGKKDISKKYLDNVRIENIPYKVKILLNMPPMLLRGLLKLKHLLKKKGLDFSIYH